MADYSGGSSGKNSSGGKKPAAERVWGLIALFFAALSLCFVCSRMMACLGCAPDFPEEHSLPPLPEFGESFDAQPIPDMPDELRDYLEGGVSGSDAG